MIEAGKIDKNLVINILAASFDTNKSVNFIVKQDKFRTWRIRKLMEHYFYLGLWFGKVLLNDNKTAAAIVIYPERVKPTPRYILAKLKLFFQCVGIRKIFAVNKRQKLIEKYLPSYPYLHLVFFGVDPSSQLKGVGSRFLTEILDLASKENRGLQLETSNEKNLPFYRKQGIEVYGKLTEKDIGYILYLLQKK
jgi:ribosomal protein S18 acetylase RimI-like enzyme